VKIAFACIVLCLVACGCNVGVTAKDVRSQSSEFSQSNLEKTMKAQGREQELEEAKKRAEEYEKAGGTVAEQR